MKAELFPSASVAKAGPIHSAAALHGLDALDAPDSEDPDGDAPFAEAGRRAWPERELAHAFYAQFSYPMLLLDPARAILEANAAARAVLRSNDVLHEREGRLACHSAHDTHALSDSIRSLQATLALQRDRAWARRRALGLQRPDGSRLYLFVSLVRAREGIVRFGMAVPALVIVHDPHAGVGELDPLLVAESFSLTPAEARVAAKLAEGRTVKEIAVDHRTSVATVRCQVQQALQKAGVTRQTDLVRLLLALPFRG